MDKFGLENLTYGPCQTPIKAKIVERYQQMCVLKIRNF